MGSEPATRGETVVKRDADSSGHVVVASARGAEAGRRIGDEFFAGASGEDAETFQHKGDVGAFQTVVAVLSLDKNFDEAGGHEAL